MTESYPGQEQQHARRLPLDTLLDHLQQLSATTADVKLNILPGLYEAEGQQLQAAPPEPILPGTNAHLLEQLHFDNLRSGDTIRGSFILDASDAVVADTEEARIWIQAVPLGPSGNIPPSVCFRHSRYFVESHRDAFRKLTGHILVLDALVEDSSPPSYEEGSAMVRVTDPQVVALERPVRIAQLEGLPEGSEVLIAGVVRSIHRNIINELEIESPTDGIVKVGAVPMINYERTIDGDAIPDTPQLDDHVFIRATQRTGMGRTPERRLFAMKVYRHLRSFDNEVRELDVKAELAGITGQLESIYNDEGFTVLCALLGRIASIAPNSKTFFEAKVVYDYYFADTAEEEVPISIAYEGFGEHLQKYNQLFDMNVTGMNVQQFRAFTLDVAYGRHVPIQETEDERQLVRGLFALSDHNPALIRTAISEVLPALAASGAAPPPLQIRLVDQAFLFAAEHLDPISAADMLAEAVVLVQEAHAAGSHENSQLFEALKSSLVYAVGLGYRRATDPEATFLQKQTIATFAELLRLLEQP